MLSHLLHKVSAVWFSWNEEAKLEKYHIFEMFMQTKQKYVTDLGFICAIYMLTIVDFVVNNTRTAATWSSLINCRRNTESFNSD